jgi:hypothetical protein
MTAFGRALRKTIFVVCEGASERGYMRGLNRFLPRAAPNCLVAITDCDARGGSAVAVVERGAREIARRRRNGDKFDATFVFLDVPAAVEELEAAKRRAARAALRPIWQPGNHEAFLLSHFPTAARPKSVEAAWPGYAKGQDAIFYERKLTLELLAAARKENAGFDEFLNVCGLLPHAAGA